MKRLVLAVSCGAVMLTGCSNQGESKPADGSSLATSANSKAASPAEAVTATSDKTFVRDVLKSSQPVLVDFYADWCGPCKMLSPIVDEAAAQYAGKIKVMKLNIDDNPQVAEALKLNAIPMLMTFKNGKLVDTSTGLVGKDEVNALVQKAL